MSNKPLRVSVALLAIGELAYIAHRVIYPDIPESRLAATNLHAASGPVRQQVADAATRKGAWSGLARSLPQSTTVDTGYGAASVKVADNGHITLNLPRHHLTLQYSPVPASGAVLWQCTGTPQRDMPLGCRWGN